MDKKLLPVTYGDILQAFLAYSASRGQSDWNELWIISQRRMSALICDRFKGKPPVEEFDGIITDATASALTAMRDRLPLCAEDVSRVFWNSYRSTVRDKFRALEKWRRMKRLAAMLNSATHTDGPDTPEALAKFWKKRKKYIRVKPATITEAQKAARRENGKKGGRPRKPIGSR